MTDRSTDTSDDRTTSTDASGGAQRLGAAQDSAAQRTSVVTDPVGDPVHGRPPEGDPRGGEAEQVMPGGEPARSLAGGTPPWYRGASGGSDIDVGRPQHATGPSGLPSGGEGPSTEEPTQTFSDRPRNSFADAPTGYFEPVAERPEEQAAEREYGQHTAPAYRPASSRVRASRAPRRASLQLKHFDPWSVLKLSLVLSVAGFLAWMVAVGVLYGVLEGMGVWDQLNGTYSDLTSVSDPESDDALISGGRVFGAAAVIGAINVVLLTAMATVGSFIYNVTSDLVGGVELTLSERD